VSNSELTSILFLLLLLTGLAQLFGWLFVKLRQPKVIGEILAGVVLGNAVVGRWPFAGHFIESTRNLGHILDFVYWLGLLLLMFLAGAETQQLFTRWNLRYQDSFRFAGRSSCGVSWSGSYQSCDYHQCSRGPGIVLASVAFDAGIVSSKFYTTLVVTAVLTSQIAGAWLDYVLRKGWPLLTPVESTTSLDRSPESPSVA
jgi:hypothetical protein